MTENPDKLSRITFHEVEPRPCEAIPGATTVEVAKVFWLEADPVIGEIAWQLSDKPPDMYSNWRVRTYWYFVPKNKNEKIVRSGIMKYDLYSLVSREYRDVYDSRNIPKKFRPVLIAKGEGYMCDDKLLQWTGLKNEWDKRDKWGISFLGKVIMACTHAWVDTRVYEANFPGGSYISYAVYTYPDEVEQLKIEAVEAMEIAFKECEREAVEDEAKRLKMAEEKRARRKPRKPRTPKS